MGGVLGHLNGGKPVASPADLAAELAAVLRTGVTVERLRKCEAICGLALTKAKSATENRDDLAVAAHTVIREAAVSVDGGKGGAAAILLALAPGTRGSLLKERRRWVAEAVHVSAEHVRKEREPLILEAVADELYAADSAYRLRHRHRTEAEQEPQHSGLGVNWLEQHRSYRRIWTPVYGMKTDLQVLLEYLAAEDEDHAAIADRLCNITWQWARFSVALERFVEEQGGLWLLADMDSEIAAADAIYRLQLLVPLGETDVSWLRTLLVEAPHEELDGFSDLLIGAGDRRRELMGIWIAWARACNGDPESDDPGCGLHEWFGAAEQFIRLIDEDWYRVADWYRGGAFVGRTRASNVNEYLPLTAIVIGVNAGRRHRLRSERGLRMCVSVAALVEIDSIKGQSALVGHPRYLYLNKHASIPLVSLFHVPLLSG